MSNLHNREQSIINLVRPSPVTAPLTAEEEDDAVNNERELR